MVVEPVEWTCMRRSYGYQQVVFEATGLGAGSHTLQVMNTGHEEPVIDGHVSGH